MRAIHTEAGRNHPGVKLFSFNLIDYTYKIKNIKLLLELLYLLSTII